MEKYHLLNLRSAIGLDNDILDLEKETFLSELSNDLNISFLPKNNGKMKTLFLIETGGTEEAFLAIYRDYQPPYILLTTQRRNSLPAALEIGAYLHQQNLPYKFLHGDRESLVSQFAGLAELHSSNDRNIIRLGAIGQPSDWLIASKIDRQIAKDKYGFDFVDIGFDEFSKEIALKQYEISEKVRKIMDINANNPYFEGALHIYGALKRLIKRHNLAGFSIRCFDLLGTFKNTSCLALALLNDEGYRAGCEGDLPILASTEIVHQCLGKQAFQANPSSINLQTKEVVFAHCTVPFGMCKKISYFTHFESNLGVGIRGEMQLGPCTIFRLSSDLCKALILQGQITINTTQNDLCRTQIVVTVIDGINKLLDAPLGNHQLIIYGHHQIALTKYLKKVNPAIELV